MITINNIRQQIQGKLLRLSEDAPDLWDASDVNGVALMVVGLAIGKGEDLRTRVGEDAFHSIAMDHVLADVERLFNEESALLRQCWAEIGAQATRDGWSDERLSDQLGASLFAFIGGNPTGPAPQ
jgi:hypothetical protein